METNEDLNPPKRTGWRLRAKYWEIIADNLRQSRLELGLRLSGGFAIRLSELGRWARMGHCVDGLWKRAYATLSANEGGGSTQRNAEASPVWVHCGYFVPPRSPAKIKMLIRRKAKWLLGNLKRLLTQRISRSNLKPLPARKSTSAPSNSSKF